MTADDRPWTPPQLRRIGLTQREFRELERERRIHDHVRRGASRGGAGRGGAGPRGRDRGGPRGRDRRLTREDIVNAAVVLADAEGVDAVSMRRLARDLRAGAMSLYWHIESKEELLDLMLEQMEAEIHAPDPSGDWRADLRTYARSIRAVLMRHPWAIDLMSARPPTGPNDARNGDRMFGVFLGLGVETRTAVWLAMTFLTYVIGSVHQQIREIRLEHEMAAASAELSDQEINAIREEFAKRFSDSGDYPNIARLITDDIDPDDPETRDERFEFGLEIMLDGIAARLPR